MFYQPPVEEKDEHEDKEGPEEEQIIEPIEKVLPEEEHLVKSKGQSIEMSLICAIT